MKSDETHKNNTGNGDTVNQRKMMKAALQKNTRKNPGESRECFRMSCEAGKHGAAVHDDITARKQEEEDLHEIEIKYQLLFNSSIDPIAVFSGTPPKFLFVNPAFLRLFGYALEEMLAFSTDDIFLTIYPEDREMVKNRLLGRLRHEDEPSQYEFRMVTKEGHVRWVEISASLFSNKGQLFSQAILRDITRRRQAQEELFKSGKKFASIFHLSPSPMVISDIATGKYIDVNRAFTNRTGYSREETIGVSSLALRMWVNPEDRQKIIETLMAEEEVDNIEVLMRSKSGNILNVLLSVRFIETGRERYLLTLCDDITDRKRAEDALKNSHRRLDEIIDFLPDATFVVDRDGKVITWNRSTERMTGISKADMIGRGDYEYAIPFYGQRRPVLVDLALMPDDVFENNHYENVYRQGDTLFAEAYVPRTYGGKGAFMWGTASRLRDASGNIIGAIESVRDITGRRRMDEELRESEKKYRTFFSTSRDCVFITSIDGMWIDMNDAAIELFGYSSRDELMQVHISDLYVKKEDRTKNINILMEKGYNRDYPVDMRRKDGGVINALITSIVQYDLDGRATGLMGTVKDITRRRKAEEEIMRAQEQMRAFAARLQMVREEERKHIAREIHDELGGSLTGIKMDFSVLAKTACKIKEESLKNSLLNQIRITTKLVDDTIRTVRKISAELRPGILDDLGILAALEWQLNDFQKRTGIHCEWISSLKEIDMDEHETMALFRIFQETLTNVFRHADATEVHVRFCAKENNYVLEVKDNGKGITKNNTDNKMSLGLLGMRERALAVGGLINVEGRSGSGTKVTVEIPVKQTDKSRTSEEGNAQ